MLCEIRVKFTDEFHLESDPSLKVGGCCGRFKIRKLSHFHQQMIQSLPTTNMGPEIAISIELNFISNRSRINTIPTQRDRITVEKIGARLRVYRLHIYIG